MEHVDRTSNPALRGLLDRCGYHYVFPLVYEDRLEGVLLLDASPRRFLGDDESVLLPLASQISHSIETCRLIEDKIGLEKALVRQEHLATLGKVSATIAHEIKNPLSSIKTLAQLMREDPGVEANYARDLAFIVGETDRLNRSVQQLLSFSRPVTEPEGPLDLSMFLGEMVELFAREYAATAIRIERRIEPGLALARASPEALRQIVLNLMLNAVQACGEPGRVGVAARRVNGAIEVSVTDSGPGIPPDLRERIFEPFFTTKQKGTGLGLAIVRKNVRNLGGEILIDSPVAGGGGTAVRIVLPVNE
jgi:signal transduction histidine kinase